MQRRHEDLLQRGTEEHYVDTELYDLEYAERTEDILWYRTLAREHLTGVDGGGTILELGAGTGRITLPLLEDGHRVIALDRMQSMLDALEQRLGGSHRSRVQLRCEDMCSLGLPTESVDMVIAPFNSLMHLYTWHDLLTCFGRVFEVCRPGAVFALDVQLPDLAWLTWDPEERHAVTRFTHPVTHETLIYSTNHRYDPRTQVCHIRIFYDEAPARGRKFRPPAVPKKLVHLAHRQIFPEELRMLVSTAGFELLSHNGDFADTPLCEGCESQTVVCKKPLE